MLTNDRLITNEVRLKDFIDKLDMRAYIQIFNNNDEMLCRDWVYEVYTKLNNYRDYYVIDINIFSSCVSLVVCTKDELREYQKILESKKQEDTMEDLIKEMIINAKKHKDYELANFTYKLMSEFAVTINCPSNWQDIGEEMAEEFKGDDWIMEFCKLYEFE